MRPERVWVGIAAAIIEQALHDRKDAMDDLLNKPGDMIALMSAMIFSTGSGA